MSSGSNDDLSAHFDSVLSEGIESALLRVIDESVVDVMSQETGTVYSSSDIFQALSKTVEDSMNDIIGEIDINDGKNNHTVELKNDSSSVADDPTPKIAKYSSHKLERIHSEHIVSRIDDTGNVHQSFSNPDEKLLNWREAGKALRSALSKITINQTQSPDTQRKGSPHNGHVFPMISRSCDRTYTSHSDIWGKNHLKRDVNSDSKLSTEASLTRSMKQNFEWKNEIDPMNEMWEDYQYTQVQANYSNSSAITDEHNTSNSETSDKSNDISPDEPVACDSQPGTNDPTLAELREKMRQLVSTLPILTNQNSASNANSDVGLRPNRSPKNVRRRHRKSSREDPLAGSDDDKEPDNEKRIPPKTHKAVHKQAKLNNSKCQKKDVKILPENELHKIKSALNRERRKNEVFIKAKSADANGLGAIRSRQSVMPELVSESSSDNGSDDFILARETMVTPQPLLLESSERTTESESGHTDSDRKCVKSIAETDSNLADIESCESEKERKTGEMLVVDITEGTAHNCNMDMPVLYSDSSEEDIISQKLAQKLGFKNLSDDDDDDLELFDDLPDLVLSSDSVSDDTLDLTLSQHDMKSLHDSYITDSSDAEAGVEGDDEFECDCSICQCQTDSPTRADNDPMPEEHLNADGGGSGNDDDDEFGMRYLIDLTVEFQEYNESNSGEESDILPHIIPALSPLGLLNSDSYRRDILDLMFTNVIMHMLSVYPDLLTEHTPPPVPDDIYKSFSVIKVTQLLIDDDASCPICLCQFVLDEELKKLPCSHFFHQLCIRAWINKAGTCPVCRHNLTLTMSGSES